MCRGQAGDLMTPVDWGWHCVPTSRAKKKKRFGNLWRVGPVYLQKTSSECLIGKLERSAAGAWSGITYQYTSVLGFRSPVNEKQFLPSFWIDSRSYHRGFGKLAGILTIWLQLTFHRTRGNDDAVFCHEGFFDLRRDDICCLRMFAHLWDRSLEAWEWRAS